MTRLKQTSITRDAQEIATAEPIVGVEIAMDILDTVCQESRADRTLQDILDQLCEYYNDETSVDGETHGY